MGRIPTNKKFEHIKPGLFYKFTYADENGSAADVIGIALLRTSAHLCSAMQLVPTEFSNKLRVNEVVVLTVAGDIVSLAPVDVVEMHNMLPEFKRVMLTAKRSILDYVDEVKALYGTSAADIAQSRQMVMKFYQGAMTAVNDVKALGHNIALCTTAPLYDFACNLEDAISSDAVDKGYTIACEVFEGSPKRDCFIRVTMREPLKVDATCTFVEKKQVMTEYALTIGDEELHIFNAKQHPVAKRWGIEWYFSHKDVKRAEKLLLEPCRNPYGNYFGKTQHDDGSNCDVSIEDLIDATDGKLQYTVVVLIEPGSLNGPAVNLDKAFAERIANKVRKHL